MQLIAKTFHGLEEVLAAELKELGATHVKTLTRAVEFEGDQKLLYRANLELRTALRILVPFHSFKTKHENHLYSKIYEIDWLKYLDLDKTFAIGAVTKSKYLNHSQYVALKIKDAIVDQFRSRTGSRPNIDTRRPDIRIHVHISRDNVCSLALDSSGHSLNQRGYRVSIVDAPINEVLAAGMIRLTGWKKDCDFIDPMCGSGTHLIEAALYAYNIPPQLRRKAFCFQHWQDFNRSLWEEVIEEAIGRIANFPHRILGYDKSFQAVDITKANITAAQLEGKITVERQDFARLERPSERGLIIMNPPYDERMAISNIQEFYKMIGDRFKKEFTGYSAWIISSNKAALGYVRLRASKKMTLYNGALDCRFQGYELYKGSKVEKATK